VSFRGALIGCGFARNHMHGWADAEGAEIVAVCDLDRGKAEAFRAGLRRGRGFHRRRRDAGGAAGLRRRGDPGREPPAAVEMSLGHGALTVCQKPLAPAMATA